MKSYFLYGVFSFVSIGLFLTPSTAEALTYSGWIPYWKKTTGAAETTTNLAKLNKISPFSYTVNSDGTLVDRLDISKDPWPKLLASAKTKKKAIIPSVLWTDSAAMDKILSDPKKRSVHIDDIVGEALGRSFDGIDIDYENKLASTSPHFSVFLKELGTKLHSYKKTLSCTIESRTPPDSKYLVVPKKIEYANDFKAINQYCDEVRLMAYNQGTVDIKLNMVRRLGGFYYPIADPVWVRKLVALAVKDINPKKLSLGVATYGYELEVTDKNKYFDYKQVRSLTYKELVQLSKETKRPIVRDNAGELALTYLTRDGKMRFATFSDSRAISDKIQIAREFGLAGVTIFKLDGESDAAYWNYVN